MNHSPNECIRLVNELRVKVRGAAVHEPISTSLDLESVALLMADELLTLREEKASPMRETELSLAYQMASGIIESSCVLIATNDNFEELVGEWYDLNSAAGEDLPIDIEEEVAYLESRRLLLRNPEHPRWVQILDEGEPVPATETGKPSAADLDAIAAEAQAKAATAKVGA